MWFWSEKPAFSGNSLSEEKYIKPEAAEVYSFIQTTIMAALDICVRSCGVFLIVFLGRTSKLCLFKSTKLGSRGEEK